MIIERDINRVSEEKICFFAIARDPPKKSRQSSGILKEKKL